MQKDAFVSSANLRQAHRRRDYCVHHRQMLPKVLLHRGHDVPAKVGLIHHREKHPTDLQLGVDLTLDALYCSDQFGHVLSSQIVRLNGNENIVRGRQRVDDQHAERGAAVQQHIIVVSFYAVDILLQDSFAAHHVDQPHLHSGQAAVGRHKVEAFRMVQDFRMPTAFHTRYNVVHHIGKRQRHFMRLALAQHLGQITLGVHVQKQDLFAVHCQACADAVHAGAFPDAAFLIGDGNDLCFRHFGFLLLYQIRRSRR